MSRIRTTLKKLFPGLHHWSHLGAFQGCAALACGVGTSVALHLSRFFFQMQLYLFLLSAATFCLAGGVLVQKKPLRPVFFFFAGVALFLFHDASYRRTIAAVETSSGTKAGFYGDIITAPSPDRDRFTFLFTVRETDAEEAVQLTGKTFKCFSTQLPPPAGSLRITGMLSPPDKRESRYDFDEYLWYKANGIAGKIMIDTIVGSQLPRSISNRMAAGFRRSVLAVIKSYRSIRYRSVIRAAFLGEKGSLSSTTKLAFRRSGLYHLLALSGLHAGILLAAVYIVFALFPLPAYFGHLTALAVLWLYFLYIGPLPSLARATVMATAVIFSVMAERRHYPLQALGIAGLVWLCVSPDSLFLPGFQLSFAATFGIITLYPMLAESFRGISNPVVAYILQKPLAPFFVSLSAFLFTLPVLLYHFGAVSLYGLIANIVAVAAMTGGMWFFFLALLTSSWVPWVSGLAVEGSGIFIEILLRIADGAAGVPFSLVTSYVPYPETAAGYVLLLIATVTVARRKRPVVLLWCVPLFLSSIAAGYLVRRGTAVPLVACFNIEKEAAVSAVRWPHGDTWLFCTGNERVAGRALSRTVDGWRRHLPGTVIDRIFYAGPDGSITDFRPSPGCRKKYAGVDTLIITQNSAQTNKVLFIPAADRSELHIEGYRGFGCCRYTGTGLVIKGAGDTGEKAVSLPVEVHFGRKRYSVRAMN